jgi:hypothetical protein
MQTRHRAAATALLLTATAGMAATGGAAEASGTHHAGDRAARTLTVTIKSKAGAVKLSDDKIRPGNTIFKVKNVDGKASKGLVQIFRLRPGYDLSQAASDFQNLFAEPPDMDVIHRIDDNVVFYGGMEAKGDGSKVSKWAVNIDRPGTYYVVNLDSGAPPSTLTAKGDHQKRALPSRDGFINAKTGAHGVGNKFVAGRHNANRGWMSTRNKAEEPHFVDVEQVKKGTKNSDITKLFEGSGPNVFVKHGGSADTGVISPGHRFLWAYHVPKGRYGVLCFWPSSTDGMPHALMGMHTVTRLG